MTMLDTLRRRGLKVVDDGAPDAPGPYYDEEVLRVAQRDYDQKQSIARLENERDEWRRRALSFERETQRLEERLAKAEQDHAAMIAGLIEQRDTKVEELTRRRDHYGNKLTTLSSEFNVLGSSIISLGEMVRASMEKIRLEAAVSNVANASGLAPVAAALDDDPLPRCVTDGPRTDEE